MKEGLKREGLKREELLSLRDALNELMKFIRKLQCNEVPYFYHFLDYMKNNIEFCVCIQSDDMEHLEEILLRDWTAANDTFLGIPSYNFFDESSEGQQELCVQYLILLAEIEKYFTYKEKEIDAGRIS